VIIATVSLVLVGLILEAILMVALMSDTLASIIASLVASLVVGYVFALKIQEESRIRAIGVIVILSAFALLTFMSIWIATPSGSPWFGDSLNSMFNKTLWTDFDLNAYAALAQSAEVIIAAVTIFIGLYAGSMLRKPKKTKKNDSLQLSMKNQKIQPLFLYLEVCARLIFRTDDNATRE